MVVPTSKCNFCFGYGFWPDEGMPIEEEDAVKGVDSDDCWNCNSNNAFYEALSDSFESFEEDMDLFTPTKTLASISTLKDFDKLCAE